MNAANPLDLRSDTLTQACPGMRQAMAEAKVGDALMGEDPSVIELEQTLAQHFGFRFAFFVPSGTMGNQVLLRCQSEPGQAILAPQNSHIFHYESGAVAALAGLQLVAAPLLDGSRYIIDPQSLAQLLPNPAEFFRPPVQLVAVENTCMEAAGAIYPQAQLERLGETCARLGLRLHIDGARIWHALGDRPDGSMAERPTWLGQCAASLSVCLSKGLGAPVGSVSLLNDPEGAQRFKRFQRMYGGCMRQAGHMAAAALYAFEHNRQRLLETHVLAEAFAHFCRGRWPNFQVRYGGTNIVILEGNDASTLQSEISRDYGLSLSLLSPHRLRAVFHLDNDPALLRATLGL